MFTRKTATPDPHRDLSDCLDRVVTAAIAAKIDRRQIAAVLESAAEQLRLAWACSAPVL
jgi:hypothetical protein